MKNQLTKKDLGMCWFNWFYKVVLPYNMLSLTGSAIISLAEKLYLMTFLYIIDIVIIATAFITYIVSRKKSPPYPIALFYLTLCWCCSAVLINAFNGVGSSLLAVVVLFIPNIIYFTKRRHLYK